MKRLLILPILTFLLITPVYATSYVAQDYFLSRATYRINTSAQLYEYTNYNEFISNTYNKDMLNTLYSSLMTSYDNYKITYPYYSIGLSLLSSSNTSFDHSLVLFYLFAVDDVNEQIDFYQSAHVGVRILSFYYDGTYYTPLVGTTGTNDLYSQFYTVTDTDRNTDIMLDRLFDPSYRPNLNLYYSNGYKHYYSSPQAFETNNIEHQLLLESFDVVNSNNQTIASYNQGDSIPFLYTNDNLYDPDNSSNLATVDLDDYEYVLLSLKNYDVTVSFQTSFSVKGQIGITPIYNYGRTSKDQITGSQVQDRCNLSYSDYTTYPFYILTTDLQNDAIYAVKSCSSGSSFKYDTTVFDITYVTQSNLSDPTVTIDGKTYHTIPYADLPSTATQNELDNYIPGQSNQVGSGSGLSSAVKNLQNDLANFWATITYFLSFSAQLFSALPSVIQSILISALTISITLGLIKIFTS